MTDVPRLPRFDLIDDWVGERLERAQRHRHDRRLHKVGWDDAMEPEGRGWWSPRAEVRSGNPQLFPRPGPPDSQTWIVHVNAHEEPRGFWLEERFDDLDNGLLHGQHRWSRIDDSPTIEGSTAKVVHIPAGNRVYAVDKDVPIQIHGKHRLDVRVVFVDAGVAFQAKPLVDPEGNTGGAGLVVDAHADGAAE